MPIKFLPPFARASLAIISSFGLRPSLARAQTAIESPPDGQATNPTLGDSTGIRPEHVWTKGYLHLVVDDTTAVLTAPLSWNQAQWCETATALGSIGLTATFDRTIRLHVQAARSPGEDRFMRQWQNINTFYILGAFEAWGEIGGDVRARNTAMDGLSASIIASGLITPSLKFIVGRERPYRTTATFKFKPLSSNYSFPSGHATQAFAVATVIAEHYPIWWVEGLAYGSAGLIGYARIEQNAHFASDVVAGSLIGWSVARAIVHRHSGPSDPKKLSWSPYAAGRQSGLVFFRSF